MNNINLIKLTQLLRTIVSALSSKFYINTFVFIVFIVILYSYAFFVGVNSVNIPYWDQWAISDVMVHRFDLSEILLWQNNEHRIGIGLLIMKVLAHFSNWNQFWEISFISALMISTSLIFSFLKYLSSKTLETTDIILPLVFLNIFQYENITWGFQIAFVLPLFFFSIWLLSIRIPNQKYRYTVMTLVSLLSSFSSLHGLALPFFTIILSAFEYFKHRIINWKELLTILLLNSAIFGLYSYNYQHATIGDIAPPTITEMFTYIIKAVASGFFLLGDQTNYFLLTIAAVTVLVSVITIILQLLRKDRADINLYISFFSVTYSLIFIALITAGRSTYVGTIGDLSFVGIASRYISFTMLLPVGLYFAYSTLKKGGYLKIGLLVFVLLSTFFNAKDATSVATELTNRKKQAMQCYIHPNNYTEKCFNIFNLHPSNEFLSSKISPVLELKKLR